MFLSRIEKNRERHADTGNIPSTTSSNYSGGRTMFLSRKEKNRKNHSYTGNMPSGLRCVTCRCGASKKWSHALCSSCELACAQFPAPLSERSLSRVAFYGDSSCYCKYSNAQKNPKRILRLRSPGPATRFSHVHQVPCWQRRPRHHRHDSRRSAARRSYFIYPGQ